MGDEVTGIMVRLILFSRGLQKNSFVERARNALGDLRFYGRIALH